MDACWVVRTRRAPARHMNTPSKMAVTIAVGWRWSAIDAWKRVRWWSEPIKCWPLRSCTGISTRSTPLKIRCIVRPRTWSASCASYPPSPERSRPGCARWALASRTFKLSYDGVGGAALSTRMPTDHLKRLLGYVAEIAKRRPFSLFIDELQDVADRLESREGEATLGLLRSELQRMRIACFFSRAVRARASARSLSATLCPSLSPRGSSRSSQSLGITSHATFRRRSKKGAFKASRELIDMLLAVGG
jgi:hypothetical protein